MSTLTTSFIMTVFLIGLSFASEQKSSLETIYMEIPHIMTIDDNFAIRDVPNSPLSVLEAGRAYVQSMNDSKSVSFANFAGRWKYEPERILGPFIPECKNLRVFGKNFDEQKYFCYDEKVSDCVVYSVGSNNVWDFEVNIFRNTNCTIETFDCTVNATIPPEIISRTRYHKYCLGRHQYGDKFKTLQGLNAIVGRNTPPDYFKMDIEGRHSIVDAFTRPLLSYVYFLL